MKKLSVFLYTLALGSAFYSCSTAKQDTPQTDYTQYVDPFIGAADNGHTFPGACRPFGMIQTSPVTGAVGWRYCSEYMYADSIIWGFTQTHLNGTGCMDLGDILVMPFTGERHRTWNAYRSSFSKTSENATPGYYTVTLDQAKVKAELTATTHAALHRYTYEQADSASILIDLQHGPAWNEKQYHSQVNSCEVNWENDSTLTGHVNNKVWVDQDYYFVMQFSHPVIDHFELPMAETEKGKRLVASFNIQPGEEVLMKVALSTTGVEGAKANMAAEVPGWDFEGIRTAAKADWNSYLSRIEVEGTDEEKTNFYTSFYHALIQPNEISDVDAQKINFGCLILRSSRILNNTSKPSMAGSVISLIIKSGVAFAQSSNNSSPSSASDTRKPKFVMILDNSIRMILESSAIIQSSIAPPTQTQIPKPGILKHKD